VLAVELVRILAGQVHLANMVDDRAKESRVLGLLLSLHLEGDFFISFLGFLGFFNEFFLFC